MPTDVVRPFGMRVTRSARVARHRAVPREQLAALGQEHAAGTVRPTGSRSGRRSPRPRSRAGRAPLRTAPRADPRRPRGSACPRSRARSTRAAARPAAAAARSPLSIAARHPEAAVVTRALNGSSPGGGHACPAGGDTTNRKAWARSSSTLVRAQTSGAHASSPAATRGSEMSESSSHRHSPATVRSPADSRPAGRSSIALLPGGGHRGPSRRHAPSPGRRRSPGRVRA